MNTDPGVKQNRRIFFFLQQDYIIPELLITSSLKFAWESYLNIRQQRLVQALPEMPVRVARIMTETEYDKYRAYAIDKMRLDMIYSVYSTITHALDMLFGGSRFFWRYGEKMSKYYGFRADLQILPSISFLLSKHLTETMVSLPYSIYQTFVLDKKYDIDNITTTAFLKHLVKEFILYGVTEIPSNCGLIWLSENSGKNVPLYAMFLMGGCNALMSTINPDLLGLTSTISPLPEGELKQKIEQLAKSVNFPLENIDIVDTTRKAFDSNAFLTGILKNKRIILTDKLVKQFWKSPLSSLDTPSDSDQGCTSDEVLGVIAHEIGHWHFGHVSTELVTGQLYNIFNTLCFAALWNSDTLFKAFGFTDEQPILIRLSLISIAVKPINKVINWGRNIITRRQDFKADAYAKELGYGEPLKNALRKLYKDKLRYPIYDHLYSSWRFAHPTLFERVEALG